MNMDYKNNNEMFDLKPSVLFSVSREKKMGKNLQI